MLERIKRRLEIDRSITNEWADLVTDGRDAEFRRIRDTEGDQAAEEWLKGESRIVRRIAKHPRIPSD